MGCLEGLDTPDGMAGFITVDIQSTGGGGFATRPFGVFYDETDLFFNRATPGSCALLPYSDEAPDFNGGKTMNVGESIATTLPTGTHELVAEVDFGFTFYRAGNAGGIALVPGDTMTFSVPGGDGFPAATIAEALPQTFTYADVQVPEVRGPIALSWTAPTLEGSIINYSLRYADDFATGEVNQQISCWFEDTGTAEIPASFVDGWIRSKDDLREVFVTRLRSKVVQIEEDVELTMIATLMIPTEPITQ